jgi:hypothetical protein
MAFLTRHISISISKSVAEVYAFVSDPLNLPKWAAGLSGSIKKEGPDWVADSPMGKVKVKFAGTNVFGVLDHDVTLPSGVRFYNPMRVVANDNGSEVIFTLFRVPGMSDENFQEDAQSVNRDLKKLKEILET